MFGVARGGTGAERGCAALGRSRGRRRGGRPAPLPPSERGREREKGARDWYGKTGAAGAQSPPTTRLPRPEPQHSLSPRCSWRHGQLSAELRPQHAQALILTVRDRPDHMCCSASRIVLILECVDVWNEWSRTLLTRFQSSNCLTVFAGPVDCCRPRCPEAWRCCWSWSSKRRLETRRCGQKALTDNNRKRLRDRRCLISNLSCLPTTGTQQS